MGRHLLLEGILFIVAYSGIGFLMGYFSSKYEVDDLVMFIPFVFGMINIILINYLDESGYRPLPLLTTFWFFAGCVTAYFARNVADFLFVYIAIGYGMIGGHWLFYMANMWDNICDDICRLITKIFKFFHKQKSRILDDLVESAVGPVM